MTSCHEWRGFFALQIQKSKNIGYMKLRLCKNVVTRGFGYTTGWLHD